MKTFDTREGIESYLKDGLAGLHRLKKDRRRYVDETKRFDLQEWVLLGSFVLDRCANFSPITEGVPADTTHCVPNVITREEAPAFTPSITSTSRHALPPLDEVCPRCLAGWTMDRVRDHHRVAEPKGIVDSKDVAVRTYHVACYRYEVHERVLEDLTIAFSAAQFEAGGSLVFRAIPNEYWPVAYQKEPWVSPWFLVETSWLGLLKVGWRKSVIHLGVGPGQSCDFDWAELFADEDVTKEKDMIHAHGYKKLGEYLARLRESARARLWVAK